MKKLAIFSLSLAAVLAMGVMAGCTPSDNTKPSDGDDATVPEYYMPQWSGRENEEREVSVHDPSIFQDPADGTYYAFGTHYAVASSADLINWTQVAGDNDYEALYGENCQTAEGYSAWPKALQDTLDVVMPSASVTTTWAPDVEYHDGTYYMYYSLTSAFGSRNSAIGRVESNRVMGPYGNNVVLIDSMGGSGSDPNCIDPELFYDKDGGLWMVYGSFFGGIYILELENEGENWGLPKEGQGYGKRLWGSDRSGMEGPFIFYNEDTGYYYLMTSHGDLNTNYNMRVARSENPDGPYVDITGENVEGNSGGGNKLAGNYVLGDANGYAAIGHNSVIKTSSEESGDRYLVVSHARRQAGDTGVTPAHSVYVFQLYFNEDGWPVMNPNRYADEVTGTGIEDEMLVGDFDLVLHTEGTTAEFAQSSVYSLAADGNVTKDGGNVGTWERSGDYYITVTLDGIEYKGVVTPSYRMYERSVYENYPVWSITATSNTGRALWMVGQFEAD